MLGVLDDYVKAATDCLGNQTLDFDLVGFDTQEEQLQALKDGEIDMIFHFSQNPDAAGQHILCSKSGRFILVFLLILTVVLVSLKKSRITEIGMHSEWTVSGKEAVIRAKHSMEIGDEFYAYIIDWLMPDMNGIETVQRIRRVIGDSKPIIILTAYDRSVWKR